MRLIASILLLVMSLLTVQPLVATTCRKMQTESCCKKTETKSCCAKKAKDTCKKEKSEGKCCGDGICTACACCLVATIEKAGFAFTSSAEIKSLLFVQDKNALAGHLNSPFQPPELLTAA